MKYRVIAAGALAVALAWAAQSSAQRAPTAKAPRGEKDGVIDPKADAQLRKMSTFLGGLRSFTVDTSSVVEKFTREGQKIQQLRESRVTVKRPDGLRVDRVGPMGPVVFRYDGKQFSLYVPERKLYGTAPAPAQLDEAIDAARERLHVDAPAGDLLLSRPYEALIDGVREGRYIGREPVKGVMAHHLAITEDKVDWQIWIQDGPAPLPIRYVITSKDLPGHPQFVVDLHNWQPHAPVTASAFGFRPPPGAKRIALDVRSMKKAVPGEEGPP
jgi:hypothetical protein